MLNKKITEDNKQFIDAHKWAINLLRQELSKTYKKWNKQEGIRRRTLKTLLKIQRSVLRRYEATLSYSFFSEELRREYAIYRRAVKSRIR